MSDRVVRAGTAVVIIRDGKVLLGLRAGSHAAGMWALIGGGMEYGETPEQAACREIREETGLRVSGIRSLGLWADDQHMGHGKHYVCLYFAATADGEPRIVEPDKCRELRWFAPEDIPENLMSAASTRQAIELALAS